jgi:hypothetical protein
MASPTYGRMNTVPRLPLTAFRSHIQPYQTMSPLSARMPRMPGLPSFIQPGVVQAPQGTVAMMQPQAPTVPGGGRSFSTAGSPYRVMRTGMFPSVGRGGGAAIRQATLPPVIRRP